VSSLKLLNLYYEKNLEGFLSNYFSLLIFWISKKGEFPLVEGSFRNLTFIQLPLSPSLSIILASICLSMLLLKKF